VGKKSTLEPKPRRGLFGKSRAIRALTIDKWASFYFFRAIKDFDATHRSVSAKTNFRSLRSRSTIPCS
jgi:hypothetical protein